MSAEQSTQGRFLSGSTMGHVIRMTATGAFGITFVFLVDAANLFWISQLGDAQLVAAIGFAYAIQFFSVSVGVGLMIAATAMVSRSIGQGARDTARAQAGATLAIACLVQGLVALLIFLFRHQLVAFAGATGDTAILAARYLGFTVFSLLPMAVYFICSGALRADGYAAQSMYITLIAGAVLMVLDPILILWMGLGLDGAAIGVAIFRCLMMGLAIYYAAYQNDLVARPEKAAIRNVARPYAALCLPVIATQLATPVGNYLLTMVIAPFGDDAVAAWAVVGRLTVVVFGGIFALSGAIGGIFGQNFGAGQMDRVRSTYKDALIFCLIYCIVAWLLLILAGPQVARIFGLTGTGAEVLLAFTTIGVGGFIFVGTLFVSNAAFNNLGQPMRSTLLNWVTHGVLCWPLALWLAGSFGGPGVIYGQALANTVVGLAAGVWGWHFTSALRRDAALDLQRPRPYPNPDRYRIR